MASMTYNSPQRLAVTEQPQAICEIYPTDQKFDFDAKHNDKVACENCSAQGHNRPTHSDHRHCHNGRLRRFLVPSIIALVILAGFMTFTCMSGYDLASWGTENLVSRAVGDGTNGTGNNTFVNRKLYLIVIFVGLLIVLILAICLSAWCCRGAFENPLCCPCYLCACCGGLACLECIGCGLCAEGLDQM